MSAYSTEKQCKLSSSAAAYYVIVGSKTAPSPAFRHRNGFLVTAAMVATTLAYISNVGCKGEASSPPVAHTSVIKILPPFVSLKDRLQGKAGVQGALLGREKIQKSEEKLSQAAVGQDIYTRDFKAQGVAKVAKDVNLMVHAAEVNVRSTGAVEAKDVQEAAEFAAKKAVKDIKGVKAVVHLEKAVAAIADGKSTRAFLGAGAAADWAKRAARIADEEMANAQQLSTDAKALQAIAQQAADEAAVAQETAQVAGAKADKAEEEAMQALKVVEEMYTQGEVVDTLEDLEEALEEALAEAKEAVATFNQLIEMAARAKEEAEEAAEKAERAADVADLVALEAENAAMDANDATAMAEQAAKQVLEAASEITVVSLKANAAEKQWVGLHQSGGQDPLLIQ